MCQFSIHKTTNTLGVYSFTTGFVASPKRTPRTEDDILAYALWLDRHGREEEALNFLERYCSKK